MHPAWAGAGGNWPAIDEVFDPKIIKQQNDLSCGAACGEMLMKDRQINIHQEVIANLTGMPTSPERLAAVLNRLNSNASGQWRGGFLEIPGATQFQIFELLNSIGIWAAVFWESGAAIGHMILGIRCSNRAHGNR